MAVKRGEVWLADLSPTIGTEQVGIRPVRPLTTAFAPLFQYHFKLKKVSGGTGTLTLTFPQDL